MTSPASLPLGSAENPIRRRAARVLLIDDGGRVLLLRGFNPAEPGRRYWFTIGGGLDPGESLVDAAVRELREETGLDVAPEQLSGPLRCDVVTFPYDGDWYEQEQDFFVCRVPAWDVRTDGFDVEERRSVDGHQWWTPDELIATTDTVYPPDLAGLVRAILEA